VKAAAIAALLALATPAAADTSDRTQVIIADGASDALITGGVLIDPPAGKGLFELGVLGAMIGGPIVHLAHGDYGRAGLSVGARLVIPGVGMYLGDTLCEHTGHHGLDCLTSLFVGGAIGLLGAQVLDATAISRGPQPAPMTLGFGGRF
jgi:hypothetical protein